MTQCFCGIALTTFLFSGIFFFKLWRSGRDPLFLYFAFGSWLLSLERLVAGFVNEGHFDPRPGVFDSLAWIFTIRLLAFLLISVAVIRKNLSPDAKIPFLLGKDDKKL